MNLATQYAKALLSAQKPSMAALSEALRRRGHLKLLPQIYAEYKKLEEGRARTKRHREPTEESERTRVLFELYKKLTNG